jgi:hypothetical protein
VRDDRLDLPLSECRMRPARDAQASPEETEAGDVFLPLASARQEDTVGRAVHGRLGWYSMNQPPGLCEMFSTELTVSTSGWGTAPG